MILNETKRNKKKQTENEKNDIKLIEDLNYKQKKKTKI